MRTVLIISAVILSIGVISSLALVFGPSLFGKKPPVTTSIREESMQVTPPPESPTTAGDFKMSYPIDPSTPFVKGLELNYILFGTVAQVKQINENNWEVILSSSNYPKSVKIPVALSDNPQISDMKRNSITIDQIKQGYFATISVVINKENKWKVLSIYIQQ